MDSLTQIVLGAAVGEAVAGKKIGNRAMIWGGIAGTIPDLDIIGNAFMSKVDALAFHRGISHSFLFAILFSFVMVYISQRFYKHDFYQKTWYKYFCAVLLLIVLSVLVFLVGSIIQSISPIWVTIVYSMLMVLFLVHMGKRLYYDYIGGDKDATSMSYSSWYVLFLMSIGTHPILDCFTTYGTQLFAPFSDYRVAFNSVSVADPFYTLPFIILLIAASFYSRNSSIRRLLNYGGLLISSLYLMWTVNNHGKVSEIFEDSLHSQNIPYIQCFTSPTILQNFLWYNIAESDSVYYIGQYSLFDTERKINLTPIAKSHHLIADGEGDYTIDVLKWFSKGYYNVIKRRDGYLQLNDMRYGSLRGSPKTEDDYIFRFKLDKGDDGKYIMLDEEGGPPKGFDTKKLFQDLVERIKGI